MSRPLIATTRRNGSPSSQLQGVACSESMQRMSRYANDRGWQEDYLESTG